MNERGAILEPFNGVYSIQQVSDITGISKQLIRKWEGRYDMIQPERLDNGYRIYTENDINTLLTVKALSEQGHSIKQAVMILKSKEKEKTPMSMRTRQSTYRHVEWNYSVLELLQYGTHCNEEGMTLTLQHAYHHLGLEVCINSVIIPFLKEVGQRWEHGKWSEYQETLASVAVRDFLIQIRRNFQSRENAPLIIVACLPNERHEIPVHLLLLQIMLKGYKTLMIGSSPAPGTIESLVTQLKPNKAILSATTTIPFKTDPHLLEKLDQFAASHQQTTFYLGGAGSIEYASRTRLHTIQLTNSVEEIFV
jgi:MerR family transcriptional regulator, light-induced transcriptional regulator